jgi:hypothetical protein
VEEIRFQRCLLQLQIEENEVRLVPWEVEMPGGKPKGVIEIVSEDMMEEVEDYFETDIMTALDEDLAVFASLPIPPAGSVVLRVPQAHKGWCDKARELLQKDRQEMLAIDAPAY